MGVHDQDLGFIYTKVDIKKEDMPDGEYYLPVDYDRLRNLLMEHPREAIELAIMNGAFDPETGKIKDEYKQDNFIDYFEWQILEMVDLADHLMLSGSIAPIFFKTLFPLLEHKPIKELTGNEWEWVDVSDFHDEPEGTTFQNRRFSEIFKTSEGASWIKGRLFSDTEGVSWFTRGADSFTPVTFPLKVQDLKHEEILEPTTDEGDE